MTVTATNNGDLPKNLSKTSKATTPGDLTRVVVVTIPPGYTEEKVSSFREIMEAQFSDTGLKVILVPDDSRVYLLN
jgi:hypothetical protein